MVSSTVKSRMVYLNIYEFHKRKAEASHGDFVLDEYDSLHALSAFLPYT